MQVLVNENNRVNEQILQLYATDRDEGTNGQVTFEFDGGPVNGNSGNSNLLNSRKNNDES